MLDNIFSFLSDILYSPYPALIALIANICTILWFLYKNRKQDKAIQDLQLQVKLSNSNSLEHVQNKIIWLSTDDVIKLYKELQDKDLWNKYANAEDFREALAIFIKYAETVQSQMDNITNMIDFTNKRLDISQNILMDSIEE